MNGNYKIVKGIFSPKFKCTFLFQHCTQLRSVGKKMHRKLFNCTQASEQLTTLDGCQLVNVDIGSQTFRPLKHFKHNNSLCASLVETLTWCYITSQTKNAGTKEGPVEIWSPSLDLRCRPWDAYRSKIKGIFGEKSSAKVRCYFGYTSESQ